MPNCCVGKDMIWGDNGWDNYLQVEKIEVLVTGVLINHHHPFEASLIIIIWYTHIRDYK